MMEKIMGIFNTVYNGLKNIRVTFWVNKFKKKYPDAKYFYPALRELNSQANQDYIVYENFFKKNEGVKRIFCDIGGNHPYNLNNTIYFEQLVGGDEWSGIAFEPLPHLAELWRKTRKAKLFPFALSDKSGRQKFIVVHNKTGWEDMLSYVKSEDGIEFGEYKTEEIDIELKTFYDVAKDENITKVDYMSLDVEGHELNVLKGINFDFTTINVLTIENNTPKSVYGNDNIRNFMFRKGFILWGRIHALDDIYVRREFYECIK